MLIDQSKLNEKVEVSLAGIASLFPRLISNLQLERKEDFLEADLINPFQKDRNIGISTSGLEITLFFGESHYHIDAWNDETETDLVERMLKDIVGIISGYTMAYSSYSGETCFGGGMQDAELRDDEFKDKSWDRADRFVVFGWEPSWDRTYNKA